MKQQQDSFLVPGVIGLLLGITLTVLFTPMWMGMMGYRSGMMGPTDGATPRSGMGRSMDAHFIEQMIPHHEDALTMADMALERAEHAELKQLATDIKRTQSAEIEKMKGWYRDWYGKDVPDAYKSMGHGMGSGSMHMGMMGDSTDIKRLESASPFDKAFIEEMIPHHQMAVMMAQMLARTTARPEMQQLAEDIIDAQTREIELMRGWYRDWYGKY